MSKYSKKTASDGGDGLSGDFEYKEKMTGEFADLLPMLRARLGITQEELAERIGATRQIIIYIENKKRPLVWSVFLSLLFLFILDPKTRPFLEASGIITPELSKHLFGDETLLAETISKLEPEKPILEKAKEMMSTMMN